MSAFTEKKSSKEFDFVLFCGGKLSFLWHILTYVLLYMFTVIGEIIPKESSIRVKPFFRLFKYAF